LANPFLVLGGIAVGIVAAGFGILQVPGWIESAQDASALNDLSNVAIGEATAASKEGRYFNGNELRLNADKLGLSFEVSNGVLLCVTRSEDSQAYAAIAVSPSGTYMARVVTSPEAGKGSTPAAALADAGGLPAGVPDPTAGDDCAPGAEFGDGRGNGGNAGGPGGGPGGGNGGGGPTTPIPTGDAVAMGQPRDVHATSHGVYVQNGSGTIFRAGDDGRAHAVTLSGPLASASVDVNGRMSSDNLGNLYVVANGVGDANEQGAVFRVNPDGSTVKLTSNNFPNTRPEQGTNAIQVWKVAASPDGTVYYTGINYVGPKVGDDDDERAGVWQIAKDGTSKFYGEIFDAGQVKDMVADDNGNVYTVNASGSVSGIGKLGSNGVESRFGESLSGGSVQGIGLASDGTVIAAAGGVIMKVTPSGDVSEVARDRTSDGPPAWQYSRDASVGADGTVYFAEIAMGNSIFKLGADGTAEPVILRG
jgi:hypothetical protein